MTVAEEGQITRAARKLHIAQPALSQAIASLEAQVGLQLLERTGRGVTLTRAGEAVLEKARVVVEAEREMQQTLGSLARGGHGTITLGYVGLPIWQLIPELFETFTGAHANLEVSTKQLRFPSTPVAAWLASVDVAIIFAMGAAPGVWTLPVRVEPRVVLASKRHSLAEQSEVTIEEVLNETFIRFEPSVDPAWAGFWSLDRYRGGRPAQLTARFAVDAQERFAMVASGAGITTAPASQAEIIASSLSGVEVIPLCDADSVTLSLAGCEDRRDEEVEALVAVARELVRDPAVRTLAT